MNIIEEFRAQVMKSVMGTPSFAAVWPTIKTSLLSVLPNLSSLSRRDIFRLGDHLSEAFLTVGGGRGQGGVSQAGIVWESTIVWYLNICLCGTKAVAIKGKKKFVPRGIEKALTVTHENSPLMTETDVLLVYLNDDALSGELTPNTNGIEKYKEVITHNFERVKLINIQCKTNWNDSAQIPMLWNMVYSPRFSHDAVSIGINGYNISNLSQFRYSFVTVPTQKDLSKFTASCLPVLRVKTLSGGAYWGRPTQASVCLSIKEIFGKNQANDGLPNVNLIGEAYVNNLRAHGNSVDYKVFALFE